jgi:uncharacterized membrane protein
LRTGHGGSRQALILNVRPVRALVLFGGHSHRAVGFILYGIGDVESVIAAQLDRHIFIDGAGVRLFFLHAQFGESFQDFMCLHLQLPRQLVDPNLLHR